MKILKMTATGADQTIAPNTLVEVSEKYPFVEWGILLSKNKEGNGRYPNLNWIKDLKKFAEGKNVNLSGHICGVWCRDILAGKEIFFQEREEILPMFQRFQLNFNAKYSTIDYGKFPALLKKYTSQGKEFILQINNAKSYVILDHVRKYVNVQALFDRSGGAGISPDAWPKTIDNVLCGYAGGIGPCNIENELKKIENVVKDKEIWIDMESKIRMDDDMFFDINRVEYCLEETKKYI
jgi:hypothetical protein